MPQLERLPICTFSVLTDSHNTKILTEADRSGLLAAILVEDLEDDKHRVIDRTLRSMSCDRLVLS